jgi:hypothetical protein
VRYYSIVISDSKGKEVRKYTSFVNNQTLAGALNIELDIPVIPFATPAGAAFVRVWGISLQEISQASDLFGMQVQVYGGMQKGLPLANPKQSGLLVQGYIFQAFGNWVGTDQTLDLIIQGDVGSAAKPKNIVLNWAKNTPLSGALKTALSTAFPDYKQDIRISDKLVLPNDEVGYYQTVAQLAQYVEDVSKTIIKDANYQGVSVLLREKTFSVFDAPTDKDPLKIQFQDLIGQPTWIESPLIQLKCVMRADLSVGDPIQLPQALVTTTPQAQSQFRNRPSFQGSFQIANLRHVGNFRQPDAASWVTNIDAFPLVTS